VSALPIVWVLAGVVGLSVLVVPALRLWREVRLLSSEVRRVARDLGSASEELQRAGDELSRRR
jgi:hypothetical protein